MFRARSYTPELLDQPHIPFADIRQNMQELDTINTLLGGHAITLKGLQMVLQHAPKHKSIHIAEIGCGDGNNLRVIQRWAKKHNRMVRLTGIDFHQACIAYAGQIGANAGIDFIFSDYRAVVFTEKPDVIFSSLFCHHFKDDALITQLQWMQQNSTLGFFINDLHRHPVAFHSIRLLTQLFSKSYLVKNDAPLSVLRGFKKQEWQNLLHQAGIRAHLQWMWAFRWLVWYRHAQE